jgi:hypothetical protein
VSRPGMVAAVIKISCVGFCQDASPALTGQSLY